MWIKTVGSTMVCLLTLSTATVAVERKNVELILDASGSMNGKLAGGVKKIDAAKDAVDYLVDKLPENINLSFRAYGHQYHRSKHVCDDTQLLVPFGKANDVASVIKSQSRGLKAQGYTPITHVLGLAADDLKPVEGEKNIILVSDGKETCKGDPCLLAKKLAAADAELVIHTIGFGVDAQTRGQLQCIARVARGNYYGANSASDLISSMREAVEAATPVTEEIVVTIKKDVPGELVVENGAYHLVFDAETGEKAKTITNSAKGRVELPAGIYNVKFGDDLLWKSIEVRAGETTVVQAGVLSINNNQYHQVRDPETGHKYVTYSNSKKSIPLPPGRYDITFEDAIWNNIELKEGETTVVEPAILKFTNHHYHSILDPVTGNKLATFTNSQKWKPLPPGTYDITFEKAIWKGFELRSGEETIVNPAILKINNHQYHVIRDAKTGDRVATMTNSDKRELLPPGKYEAMFNKVPWPFEVRAGEQKTLNPGGISIEPRTYSRVRMPDGKLATTITNSMDKAMLPPGAYVVEIGDQKVPVTLTEGKIVKIKIQ